MESVSFQGDSHPAEVGQLEDVEVVEVVLGGTVGLQQFRWGFSYAPVDH